MTMASYSSVIIRPKTVHTATLVFLHGLGDTGHSWSEILHPLLPPHCRLVCPHAPIRPLTVYDGEVMPAWFDVISRSASSAVQDPASVAEACNRLNQLLSDEAAILPAGGSAPPNSRIMLGGFSQGGALALYTGLTTRRSSQLAGLIGLSCYLPLMDQEQQGLLLNCPATQVEDAQAGSQPTQQPPVFFAHGDVDDVVLPQRSLASSQLMRQRLGVMNLRYRCYTGLAHWAGDQLEDSPHSELWSKIVSNSLVGIGVFNRAAVCNLTTGGVLATCPGDYAPTPGQVAALRDNFDTRGAALSSAGFGIGSTIYRLQEETSTKDIICGVNSDDTEGVLVTRTNTALLACAYSKDLDQAMEVLSEMRSNFIGQGM